MFIPLIDVLLLSKRVEEENKHIELSEKKEEAHICN